jgi:glycosyltransferase involved in cell wall biosynthesis
MNVSIVVITFNDVNNISECLKSILAQKFSHKFEIVVVDGISTDGTQEIIKSFAKKHKQIKVIIEKSSITEARNIGIKNSKYDFVAFTDSDCIVPKDWLEILTQNYSRLKKSDDKNSSRIVGVGGANIPPKHINDFTYAIGIAFDSFIGSLGSIQAKRFEKDTRAFSISCTNSLYEKSALEKAGLFSEDLGNQGEDWDMGFKMRKKGFILYGLKDSYVIHKMRTSPKEFWKNMIFYGDGRMRLIKKHGTDSSMKYYLPLVFLAAMIFPLIYIFKQINIFLLPLLYFPAIFLYALFLSIRKKEIKYTLNTFLVFIILHFGYALGEIKGLRWIFSRRK